MVVYLLLCISSILAGRGILRLVGIKAEPRFSLYLSPVITLTFWTIFLGWGILLGYSVKQLWIIGWLATIVLALFGLRRADYRFSKGEWILLGAVVFIPVGLMFPYFWHGIGTYLGSPAPDGWSYSAFGQYLWEYPRGAEGGLAPLYQYASHLSGSRFIASSLLGFFSPLTGLKGDTQASSGYFLAWALFVFSSSCMFFITTKNFSGKRRFMYVGLCVFSGWLLNMLQANNYDNALILSFLPTFGGVIAIIDPHHRRWAIVLAMLAAGIFYCYPEMSPFVLAGALFFMLQRILSERENLRGRWLMLLILAGAAALLITLPWLKNFIQFLQNQLAVAIKNQGPRPGEGIFRELLSPKYGLGAFWGLGYGFLNYLLASALSILSALGVFELFRRRQWGFGALIVLLFCGAMVMIFHAHYDYGAYKFILLNWWGVSFAAISGVDPLLTWFNGKRCRASIMAVFILFFVITGTRIYAFDKSVRPKSIITYKQVEEIKNIVKGEAVIVDVDAGIANEWVVYFLRDMPIHLLEYRIYMDQPHVIPFMERARHIDIQGARFLLSDGRNVDESALMSLMWSGGPYRLWKIPKGNWIVITGVTNPNGIEEWDGAQGFWAGKGDSKIRLFSARNGYAIITAELSRGPSLPDKSEVKILISTNERFEKSVTISRDGPYDFKIPVAAGKNVITLHSLEKPSVTRLPNGDTRPLLLRVKGLKVGLQ
jgi:hypothetical protein